MGLASNRKVLLPQPIEAEAVELLEKADCELVLSPDPKPETVEPLLKEVQAIILRTGIHLTKELLRHAENLQVISRTGGGVDNVDIDAASEQGVIVTSNIGVNTTSVVEHALSLMLALSKQLPLMDRSVRAHDYRIRYQNLPRDLYGKTLGLMGFGRIGSELGKACRQVFSMSVLAHDPFLPDSVKAEYEWVEFVEEDTLFRHSDVLSVHIPLTRQTHHIIGKEKLSMMKSDAILINTSRGPVIDEIALAVVLGEKKIGGAGLDVLEMEPPVENNPLLKLDNVILTPHSAALTRECVIRMATEAARCVIDVLSGKEPLNIANPDVLEQVCWSDLARRTD